ncbi:hypothetical protein I3760_11G077300 [Carya illinoinensis]|nr:hypothetical protein I3760_11G077300 [Carya illinoinensis]
MQKKYYKDEDFLNSRLGSQPSYAWRSIYGAKSLLQEGLIWRFGNGRSISIWKNRWLPKPWTFKVQTPPLNLPHIAKVQDLIDGDNRRWHANLVRQIFSDSDADCILKLPLGLMASEDKQIWQWTKSGNFFVRSAYDFSKDVE